MEEKTKQVISSFTGYLDITPQQIVESQNKNNGAIITRGILQRAESENQNDRIYPKTLLEREINSFTKKIQDGLNGGELDHPDSSVVNLKNISHKINKLWWNGNDVMGEVEILNTPAGNIAKELIKSGIRLGISSRGLGTTVMKKGKTYVNDDYNIITWDLVSDPSTHKAYLYEINENVNPVKKKQLKENLEKIDQLVLEIMDVKI